jgi:hypothetical protein
MSLCLALLLAVVATNWWHGWKPFRRKIASPNNWRAPPRAGLSTSTTSSGVNLFRALPIENLPGAAGSALMRHALAPKTCKTRMWTGLAFASKDWSTN